MGEAIQTDSTMCSLILLRLGARYSGGKDACARAKDLHVNDHCFDTLKRTKM
jgi:hypothetical protein